MGIKQLTSYVRDHFSILYKDEFHLRGEKLVFDGGALYYGIIRSSDKRFGGDYFNLYSDFKSYFLKLKDLGVTPYIVLDGGSNIPLKNATISERFDRDVKALRNLSDMKMSQGNLPKPRLLKSVFIEVLVELNINFVLAKGEADMLVAALANRLSCPLVSGDSDFFVVNVLHGVIPVDPLLFLKHNTNKCVRYRSRHLSKHLNIHESVLPMIAVTMGNDYSEEQMLNKIQIHCGAKTTNGTLLQVNERVKHVSEYLSQFKSIENAISDLSMGDHELTNHIKSVLREFDLVFFEEECNELFPILVNVSSISEKLTPIMKGNVPTEIFLKHVVYHGLANPCVLDIYLHNTHFIRPQCENTAQKSSTELAEKLRTYLYILLLHEKASSHELKITEFKRIGNGYGEISIHTTIPEWSRFYPVDILNAQYKNTDKIRILCELTGFPVDSLKIIKDEDHMFLISVRYWIQQSADSGFNLKIEYVHALILCYLHLKSGKLLSNCNILDVTTAHQYCRWQSVLFYLILLNVVFRYPFVPPCVSKVYHGNYVHHLYHLLDTGTDIYTILVSKIDNDIFNIFMNVITTNITSCLIYKRNNDRKRGRNDERAPANTFRQQYGGNRFALLRK